MAGKHVNYDSGTGTAGIAAALLEPPLYPGTRQDRAYAEGRRAGELGLLANTNPHTFASPEYASWSRGHSTSSIPWLGGQFQTATLD